MNYLDLDTWPRRRHFDYFRQYDQPFFNVTAAADVTELRLSCRADPARSFALAYHWVALQVVNEIECFRYRLRDDRVLIHDVVDLGMTVLLDDETFEFCYVDFNPNFEAFQKDARAVIQKAKSAGGGLDPQDDRDDLIHCTSIPWIAFTGAQHARRPERGDSVPKFVFGKCHQVGGRFRLPIAVDVHHALMDGLHVGRFFERFEQIASMVAAGPP